MLKNVINKILGRYRVFDRIQVPTKYGVQEFVAVELDIDIYHNKGVKYLNAKKYNKAIEMFKKEIECDDPQGSLGYHFLGRTLQAMGKTEEARNNYNIAMKNAEEMYRRYPKNMDKEIIDNIKRDLASVGG